MPTTYGNDIVYCLKSHCGVRGYCRQKWVLQVQIICKFSNERTCKRNKDVQGLSCGFEVNQTLPIDEIIICDDRSQDNTIQLIKELKIRQKNHSFSYERSFINRFSTNRKIKKSQYPNSQYSIFHVAEFL